MKKAPKRIIALLLSVILALGMLPVSVIAGGGDVDFYALQNKYNQIGKSGIVAMAHIEFSSNMIYITDSKHFSTGGHANGYEWEPNVEDWDVSDPENPILRKSVEFASFAMFPCRVLMSAVFGTDVDVSYYKNNEIVSSGSSFGHITLDSPQDIIKLVVEKEGFSKATIEVRASVAAPKADELTALRTLSINIDGKSYSPVMVDVDAMTTSFTLDFGDDMPKFSREKIEAATISYTLNRSGHIPVYYESLYGEELLTPNSNPFSSYVTHLFVGALPTESRKFREYMIDLGDYIDDDYYKVKAVRIIGSKYAHIGRTTKFLASFTPSNGINRNVTWTSSDTAVATVASDGTVTGIAPGTATITVKTEEGGFTDSVVVTVRAANTFTDNTGTGSGSNSSYDDNNYDSSSNPVASTANAATTKWITPTNSGNPTRQSGIAGVRASVLSKQNGKYSHDTTDGKAVQVRLTIPNPSLVKKDLLVSAYVKGSRVDNTVSSFGKWFSNEIKAINFDQQSEWGQPVEVAAKIDLKGMDTDNLVFYSYNKANNTYKRIPTPKYWIDNNGYLRFTTEFAGDIVVSDGVLVKK